MEKATCQKNNNRIIIGLALIILHVAGYGQNLDTLNSGTVSFTSSKNIYTRFPKTKSIQIGDTLFIKKDSGDIPAILVTNKSSSSCVGVNLLSHAFQVGDRIYFKIKQGNPSEIEHERQMVQETKRVEPMSPEPDIKSTDLLKPAQAPRQWKGRLSAASYSYIGDVSSSNSTRFQYTLSLQGNRLGGGKLSVDSYLSMRYRTDEWERVKNDLGYALKIYSLAATYEFNKNSILSAGRKINANLSNMGAIDGIQFEQKLKNFSFGCAFGSRPNITDYGFNLQLLEAGMYIHHDFEINRNNTLSNTLALIDQQSHGKTDRRFLYIQHSSNLLQNLSLFGSSELDMYSKVHDTIKSSLNVTNIYLSLRYRILKNLNISGSYDARTNVIYYETYKNDIDRLLDEETRKGLRLQINYQPIKYVSISIGSNIRFQNSGSNTSKNYNVYLSHYRVPLLNGSLSISGNYLQTDYLNSRVEGVQFSRDLFSGKFYFDLYYRRVTYTYRNFEYTSTQNLSGLSFNFRLNKTVNVGVYSEYTSESDHSYLRLNGRIMLRI